MCGRIFGDSVCLNKRLAFSLIELVVAMSIVGLLVAIVLTAVQSARESSRRTACQANLHQLGTAISAYESVHAGLPQGAAIRNFSLHVQLLPYLEQASMHTQIIANVEKEGFNSEFAMTPITVFMCPSDAGTLIYGMEYGSVEPLARFAATSYAGNYGTGMQKYGYNGSFAYEPIELGSFTDGRSNTAAISEMLVGDGSEDPLRISWSTTEALLQPDQLEEFAAKCVDPAFRNPTGVQFRRGRPWTEGQVPTTLYNHVITPNHPFCSNGGMVQQGAYPPSSNHFSVVNVLFVDGHVDTVSDSIGLQPWRRLGSRNGEGNGT